MNNSNRVDELNKSNIQVVIKFTSFWIVIIGKTNS